jgi:starch-binding outer membrane protein, SusD/RagB family
MKNLAYKIRLRHAGLLVVWMLTFMSCERAWLEPWPPDGARLPSDIWENYNFSKGILDKAFAEHLYSVNLSEFEGNAMIASATDEAEHTLPQARVQALNDGSWSPSRGIEVNYGGNYRPSVGNALIRRTPWQNSYEGIRRVNIFLANVNNSPIIDDPAIPARRYERTYFTGQAYFLRGYLQWELFRRYGAFPIVTEVLTLEDDITRPRNTLKECYDQIIADLDSAYAKLPYLHDDNNWHRPTKTMAQSVKAMVQLYYASPLYQGDPEAQPFGLPANTVGDVDRWLDVVETSRAAIQENTFHNLMSATVFTRPYTNTNTYTARLVFTFVPTQTETIWSTIQSSQMRPNLLDNEKNALPDGVEGCYGYTNPTQEMVDAFEVVTLATSTAGGNVIGKPLIGAPAVPFDWNNPAHAANPYANRDPRFYASIIHNQTLWGTSTSQRYFVDTYEGGIHRDYTRPNHTKTGYYYRKFISETFHKDVSGWRPTSITRIKNFIRFSELVLIYAEAMNEAYGPDVVHPDGPLRSIGTPSRTPSTAREALNVIRERVGMPAIPLGLSQAEMRERIKHERRIEFAFEGHRFYDLRRWKQGELLGGTIHGIKITPSGIDPVTSRPILPFTYEVVPVEERVWQDKMYWWPIPYSEVIKYGGNIRQNPEW